MQPFTFRLNPLDRIPFNYLNINQVPRASGAYIIFDLAGPIYVGRSRVDIHRRLLSHFNATGNKNLALAKKIGAAQSLTFTYCCLPTDAQADVERLLIAALGVAAFANLRHEGLYDKDFVDEP